MSEVVNVAHPHEDNTMSIKIGNYNFDGPYGSTNSLENKSGVYVILDCNSNDSCKVIDIGESKEVKDRVENHDREGCWTRNVSNTRKYAVKYCSESDRMQIEQELRKQYNPPCGKQ